MLKELDEEVHVWSSKLDQPSDVVDHCRSLLGEPDRERADRFKTPQLRNQYTVAKASLLSLIALYTGTNPRQIQLHGGEFHKPLLRYPDGFGFEFSLSHSNNLAICGFARDGSIGVDVEPIDAGKDWEEVIDTCLSDYEKDWFLRLPRQQRASSFIEIWTIKEAYLKAIGTGLVLSPTSVELELNHETGYQFRTTQDGRCGKRDWHIFTYSPAVSFTGAVVMQGQPRRLRRFTWVPELLN